MKFLGQILILLFVIFSLVLVKDDIETIYHKGLRYIQGTIVENPNQLLSLPITSMNGNSIATLVDNSKKVLQSKNDTPGPLHGVAGEFLAGTTTDTTLSLKNVIAFTNQARKEYGDLPPLKENSKLNFSAEKKVQDMFAKQYFEHDSPTGVGVGNLGDQVSYEYIIIGENLALGNFKDDAALVAAWMASPGHRANILNKKYTEIGVAVGKGFFKGQKVWMAVQHFGLPKSACPPINDILKGMIQIDQNRIKKMEDDLKVRKEQIDTGGIFGGLSHSEQIEMYNTNVKAYNALLVEAKNKISNYNADVRLFNACVSKNI